MIAITGATGQLGRLVITQLLETMPASNIIAAVRSPEKAKDLTDIGVQVRFADYNKPASLTSAFKGADKLLFISSSEIGQRVKQHKAVINAAKEVNVGLVAYTSILHADNSPLALAIEHKKTEALLRQSTIPFVLLRNGWYTENYTAGIQNALTHGVILGCANDGHISSAARADYAKAAATVLLLENQTGIIYELAGDTAYTLTELTKEISKQSGKKITYSNMPEAEYKKTLITMGLPEKIAVLLSESDTGASKGGLFDNQSQLSKLIAKPTTPLTKSVSETLNGIG